MDTNLPQHFVFLVGNTVDVSGEVSALSGWSPVSAAPFSELLLRLLVCRGVMRRVGTSLSVCLRRLSGLTACLPIRVRVRGWRVHAVCPAEGVSQVPHSMGSCV